MSTKIKNINKTLLSDNWYTLNKYSFDYQKPNGEWQHQEGEAYDRVNGSRYFFIILKNLV